MGVKYSQKFTILIPGLWENDFRSFSMLPLPPIPFLLSQSPAQPPEPDGARTVGVVPPYKALPAPPAWLRATSHALAAVDTRHYLYEVYAVLPDQWLVRYVLLPEEGEAFRDIEQIYLFTSKASDKPRRPKNEEFLFDSLEARWKDRSLPLVDRRDLMRP